ncbi:MAG: hypothetical protein CMG22_00230 [Candidatus Marinimicrobia bacterium]|nr:hypothetical protein [Candidatus Neomarinimicrobiota bacterium]
MRRHFILLLIFGFIQGQQRSSSSGNVTVLRDLEFEQIKLSYIQTDRALAVLKTLGYAVVEFRAGKGEISGENNFTPVFSNKNTNLNAPGALPIIIKLPDSENISLVEKSTSKSSSKKSALNVDLGGVVLDNTTSGEPMQRLLVGYKPGDYRPMARLRDLIQNEIDIPASQIAIEALVIEINTDNLNELGVDFTSSGPITASFPPPQGGSISPFTVVLDRTLLGTTSNFRANMEALVSAKKAEILSKPSALVLDGRQARIQVGQQIPIVKTITDQIAKTRSVDYIPVGIVLNVRPRISEDGSRITMQVETIISETEERIGAAGGDDVASAPIINNRKVQSFVRVANNTPFIIGGLINKKVTENEGGVPILGKIPILKTFFSVSGDKFTRKEVIVVITPHIITESESNFSRVIPQDAERFNMMDNQSFPNSYRVKNADIYDLNFIYDSPVFKSIKKEVENRAKKDVTLASKEPYKSLLENKIPGESIIVKRMMLDIISKLNYSQHIDPEKILYFRTSSVDPAGFEVSPLAPEIINIPKGQTLQLTYSLEGKATFEKPFVRPTALTGYISIEESFDSYKNALGELNTLGATPDEDVFTILLTESEPKYERRLYEVLILKKLLEMNPDLELTFDYFKAGIEILFPTAQVLNGNSHIVDRDAAKYFYEVNAYYGAFELEFNRFTKELSELIQQSE